MASQNNLSFQGVRYTPSSQASSIAAPSPAIDIGALRDQGIRYIRITWVDWINNVRYRVVPIPYFAKLLDTNRPGVSLAKVVFGIVFVNVAEGFSPVGEYLYAIDPSTLKICHYAPGHASVLGWFQEKEPLPGFGPADVRSLEVDFCPRTILKKVVEKAQRKASTSFLVGIESEFILLSNTSPITAVNKHGWSNSPALPASNSVENKVLEEIVERLLQGNVEVQMYHSEAAPGQYEIVTGPLEPLQAMDALVYTRETIYNVAAKHGLRATLAPRVFTESLGSAAHAHISVHSSTPSGPSKHPFLTTAESSFLAGLLAHLPSIALLLLPTPSSYLRMQDGVWSGGTYVAWGMDNREAPVRLCSATSPTSRNFELKTLDGTANPYLAMAAILGAGLSGIMENKELGVKEIPLDKQKSAAMLSKGEREELGITERLPLTWEEARAKFVNSEVVEKIFGKDFREKHAGVNKELKHQLTFGLMDVEALKLMVDNY